MVILIASLLGSTGFTLENDEVCYLRSIADDGDSASLGPGVELLSKVHLDCRPTKAPV